MNCSHKKENKWIPAYDIISEVRMGYPPASARG
jgi:hypothetical protein